MKTSLRIFVLALGAVLLSRCTEEKIVEPQAPEEDLRTTAAAYQDQFLIFKIATTTDDNSFEFTINGDGGNVAVNWGDGTIEKRTLSHTNGLFSHHYSWDRIKNYTITVSGDIKSITHFQKWYETVKVYDIHFGGLTNLEFLTIETMHNSPEVINISRNRKLKTLKFENLLTTKEIIMPSVHELNWVYFATLPYVTTPVADRIIARIHDATVANSVMNGSIVFKAGYSDGMGNKLLGSPSSYSVNKLRKLRDVYGWRVSPDIE